MKSVMLSEEVEKMAARQRALEAENERLKQVILALHSRFNLLGCAFAGRFEGTGCAPRMGASTASSPQDLAPFTPLRPSGGSSNATPVATEGASELPRQLPEVPAFPFPVAACRQAAPAAANAAAPGAALAAACAGPSLSLVEALGATAAQRMPLSLVPLLTPGVEVRTFSFTIRKADDADLGLNVSHKPEEQVLRVEGIRSEGAVDAWNRQCLSGNSTNKAVLPGDRIVSVNNISDDPVKMLKECCDKQLLRLTISRGGEAALAASPAAQASPGNSATQLRADASEFVPGGPSAPVAAAAAEVRGVPLSPGQTQDTDGSVTKETA